MAAGVKPPVSIDQWLEQVAEDPSIPDEFKHGAEDQIRLSSTSFSSGSVVTATESHRMRIIWHKLRRIEDLGTMMKDDANENYTGYVSAENSLEASFIYNTKRHLWQPYLQELKKRAAYKESYLKTRTGTANTSHSANMTIPPRPQPHRPSKECNGFYVALRWHLLGLKDFDTRVTSFDDLERTSSISKPGPDPRPTAVATFAAHNRPVTPLKPQANTQAVHEALPDEFQSTPHVLSFYPGRGGKSNKPASDESYTNMSLLLLLQAVLDIGVEFSSMEWLADRLPFKLTETVITKNITTETTVEQAQKLMEARVDGYLCRKSDPFEEELNSDALAIIEVKPYVRSSAHPAIRRQEGAEMACWISQDDDSKAGLLRPSSSGRKRRLMISQNRHEIYIIVGEYGAGFEEHIRPRRAVEQGAALPRHEARMPGDTIMGTSAQVQSLSPDPDLTTNPRDPSLLAGSPAYIRRIQSKAIVVEAKKKTREGQPIQPGNEMTESRRTQGGWSPDPGDFLIMNEFGPFLATDDNHMDLLFRRLIALVIELRGSEDRFMPEPISMKFLHQPDLSVQSTCNESSSRTECALKKSRSWPEEYEKSTQDWVKPTSKPKWRD